MGNVTLMVMGNAVLYKQITSPFCRTLYSDVMMMGKRDAVQAGTFRSVLTWINICSLYISCRQSRECTTER
jgi:hypothetical protein